MRLWMELNCIDWRHVKNLSNVCWFLELAVVARSDMNRLVVFRGASCCNGTDALELAL